ncbi:hypothetical protein BP5796_08557 [Coleophoma crateriformis]|uniref:BCS1 protein n=1 Tax=Coleophoma crateriformis TaxID=565419 RepID=A0A3D8R887_9HELO|nr:hypothetical protein BP5796_08557 [Coleophoma crateriformis]
MTEEPASPLGPQSALIDALFPGFSLLSTALYTYTRIDLTLYIPLILVVIGLALALKYLHSYVWELIESSFMSTADIRVDDEIYSMVMAWVSKQGFARRSRRFVVNASLGSRSWYVMWESRNKEEQEEEEGEDSDEGGLDLLANPKKKPPKKLNYTPSFGTHYFWFKGRLVMFKRYENRSQSYVPVSEREEVTLSTFGRDPTVLKELLTECQTLFTRQDENKTLIYRGAYKPGTTEPTWLRCMSRVSRPFSTVVLDETIKKSLLEDMRDYLHPHTRRWYSNRGIPYRRGYLLYGPPGTGKSSLSFAIAGYFDLKIYIVSLNSTAMNEENLGTLFSGLPKACVVLLEDIDTAGLTHTREKPEVIDMAAAAQPTAIPAGVTPGVPTANSSGGRISLSALLNVLDGVASQEGRILIMTTNHISKLDEALIRPGRVDMRVPFSLADTAMIITIFRGIYATLEGDYPANSKKAKSVESTSLLSEKSDAAQRALQAKAVADEKERKAAVEEARIAALGEAFAKIIPSGEFSPAEIQGYLLKYKRLAEQAITNAAAWVVEKRAEKLKQAEKEREKEKKGKADQEKAQKEKLKEKTESKEGSETMTSPTSATSRSGTSTPSSEKEGDEVVVV